MEERIAAAVCFETPPQVVPALDLMHRLILDQLFQDDGRGPPVDATQHQEAAVKPRGEKVRKIGGDGLQPGCSVRLLEDLAPHRYQNARAIGRLVEPAEQLLARRLHNLLQACEMLRRGVLAVSIAGPADLLRDRERTRGSTIQKSARRARSSSA